MCLKDGLWHWQLGRGWSIASLAAGATRRPGIRIEIRTWEAQWGRTWRSPASNQLPSMYLHMTEGAFSAAPGSGSMLGTHEASIRSAGMHTVRHCARNRGARVAQPGTHGIIDSHRTNASLTGHVASHRPAVTKCHCLVARHI